VRAVERAVDVAGLDRVRIVTGRHLVEPFRSVLPQLGDDHFLIEPQARGTAPALTWAAREIEAREPGAIMISLHADHVIAPPEAFRETIERALGAVRTEGGLFCIGIRPDRVETGFGYVELGAPSGPGAYRVRRFVEKPDRKRAERFVDSGGHLWNSGIFVWRTTDLLAAVRRHAVELRDALRRLDTGDVPGFFEASESIAIDVAVLERAERVGVVTASFAWDDVGTWDALARTGTPDARGNVTMGRVALAEACGNVVWCEQGRVTLFGVENLVVVCSGGEVLITRRDHAYDLKRFLGILEEERKKAARKKEPEGEESDR